MDSSINVRPCPETVNGILYVSMIRGGAAVLGAHKKQINDLNVFPIPDGDTGDNMLMTVCGGIRTDADGTESLADASHRIAEGMLLGARGNSGVILSQFFDGMAKGFVGADCADVTVWTEAFRSGVKQAYAAVITPTEGTILTVMREATEATAHSDAVTLTDFFACFLKEANASLDRTPSLLPVLQEAGVVDSGGAGFIRIAEGMYAVLQGADPDSLTTADSLSVSAENPHGDMDYSVFGPDSVLEFGYCTELLLRLQTAKCDPFTFDVSVITEYLNSIGGNSVVAFRTGSVVKLHVHTMTPYKVLAFCRKYGELLTVKIENMSLQHSNLSASGEESAAALTETGLIPDGQMQPSVRRRMAAVAVACGKGVKLLLSEAGADSIVDGGQSMNPSAEDFLAAIHQVNADTVFILPNNGNVIMAARQAASLCHECDVRVIETHSIGDGYAALCAGMQNANNPDETEIAMKSAVGTVTTACVSECVRDSDFDGKITHSGDYIGFIGKNILSVAPSCVRAACALFDASAHIGLQTVLILYGETSDADQAQRVAEYIQTQNAALNVSVRNGGQKIYGFMLLLQ